MSLDLLLLTRDRPTTGDLEAGALQARQLGLLGEFRVDGDLDRDVVVGVTAPDVGGAQLQLQVGRPRQVRAEGLAEVVSALRVQLPLADDGRCYRCEVTLAEPVSAAAAEAAHEALVALLAPVAGRRRGFVVVLSAGPALVELAGVAAPEPLDLFDDVARPAPPPAATVLCGASVAVDARGGAGWVRSLRAAQHLAAALGSGPVDHLLQDGEWRRLRGTDAAEAPQFWPLEQQLFAQSSGAAWQLQPAPLLGRVWVLGQRSGDVAAAGAVPSALADLAADPGLDLGFVHPWNPEERHASDAGLRGWADGPWFLPPAPDDDRLPHVYWGMVLGPRWVGSVGVDALGSLAAQGLHRSEPVPGGWLLQLTPDPADVVLDLPRVERLQRAVADVLGPALLTWAQ